MDTRTGVVMADGLYQALRDSSDPRMKNFRPSLRVQEQHLARAAREELKVAGMTRVSKNAKCPCGSRKRFKNCHRQKL